MVSRKEVAREAGVSSTSVSYYLNHSGYVSEAAAKKIQAAIEKLNYSPNQIARSLKTRTNNQFVFLCNEIRNPFFSQIVYSATKAAYQEGYGILFSNVIDDEEYLRKLCGYQVGGIFLSNGKIRRSMVENLIKLGVSIVMLADAVWENVPKEIVQIRSAVELVIPEVVEHLRQNGYQKLHFISGAVDAEHGLLDDKVRMFIRSTGLDPIGNVTYNIATAKEAECYLLESWRRGERPDAFICTNDAVAQGVIYALTQMGVRVPQDVGVVGYDNTTTSQYNIPSISSVDFGVESLGRTIIEMLIKGIRKEPVENLVITPRFLPRQSTNRKGIGELHKEDGQE